MKVYRARYTSGKTSDWYKNKFVAEWSLVNDPNKSMFSTKTGTVEEKDIPEESEFQTTITIFGYLAESLVE